MFDGKLSGGEYPGGTPKQVPQVTRESVTVDWSVYRWTSRFTAHCPLTAVWLQSFAMFNLSSLSRYLFIVHIWRTDDAIVMCREISKNTTCNCPEMGRKTAALLFIRRMLARTDRQTNNSEDKQNKWNSTRSSCRLLDCTRMSTVYRQPHLC